MVCVHVLIKKHVVQCCSTVTISKIIASTVKDKNNENMKRHFPNSMTDMKADATVDTNQRGKNSSCSLRDFNFIAVVSPNDVIPAQLVVIKLLK